jgi:hypothetical protein
MEAVLYRRCRMTPDKIELKIVNGPSRFDLMLAVFNRGAGKPPQKVDFVLRDENTGHEWISSLYVNGADLETPFKLPDDYSIQGSAMYDGDWEFFRAEYNCSRCEGTFTFVFDEKNEETEKLELEAKKSRWYLTLIERINYYHHNHDSDPEGRKFFNTIEFAKRINWAKSMQDLEKIVDEINA